MECRRDGEFDDGCDPHAQGGSARLPIVLVLIPTRTGGGEFGCTDGVVADHHCFGEEIGGEQTGIIAHLNLATDHTSLLSLHA